MTIDLDYCPTTLVDLLQKRALYHPSQTAYTFLENGEIESDSLTYQELDTKARAIASQLQSFLAPSDRVLLLYPSGLEFICAFFGCLYAGVVAIPAYPPRRNQNMSRLEAIIIDAQAAAVLTTTPLLANIQERIGENPEFNVLKSLATDNINTDQALNWQEPAINSDTLAFLQYTSGSTGTPKGVMVSHSNLLYNEQMIQIAFNHSKKTVFAGWLPLFHDMGLIGNVLQPLYLGIPCYLMSPVDFIQKPYRWLAAISRYKATTSGGPNFAYDLCVRKITPEQIATLNLSSWQVAFNGAEPIHAQTLKKFATTFAACGFRPEAFYPCYGMAETTLLVSGGLQTADPIVISVAEKALEQNQIVTTTDQQNSRKIVGCGQTWLDQEIIIVDPESLTLCRANQIGEIWVSGPHVAQGYWQRPEQTEATFNAYLADTKAGPFLRTGDLGFLQNGELFVTGRIKDVIIIRGRNHYPQDIELTVENSHPALKPGSGAAFTVEIDGEERLVIAQEVERTYIRKLDIDEVVEAIRRVVSTQHELQLYAVVLLKTGSILKTSSGKIQRQACRAAFLEDSLSVVGRWHSEPIPPQLRTDSLQLTENVSKSRADNLIKWLQSYAGERINSRIIDERRCIPPYIVLDFGNRGILGMQVPEQYGGIALSNRDTLRVIEQLAAIDLTLASFVGVHHALGTRPLMNYATSSVRDQFLPLIAQGRELGAFAITEPSAGSNPRAILSQAIPDSQGGWHLRGQKEWIGTGSWAGIINVFVQLLNENHQPMGISGFIIRQGTKGLRQGPEALTMGMRGMVQNKVYLDDVSVTSEHLLGELGGGLEVAQDAMMFGRLGLGAMSIGGMKRCTQLMLRYGSRRSIATGRLIDNPLTLNRLSEITAAITTLETLVFRIADLLDQGYSLPEEAYAACKTSGPEFLWQAADHLVQLLGGRGYIETNIAPQILRDARLLRIFEGPTETLNMFLGSRLLNKNENLYHFLSTGLEAPEITQILKAAVAQINSHFNNAKNSASDNNYNLHWLYLRTGEITTWAILLASLQGALNRCDADHLQRAFTWARLHFEQKLTNLLNGTPSELIRDDAESITAQIYSYTDAIGDIEQTLAGEDADLDELLKQESKIAKSQSPVPNSQSPVPNPQSPIPNPQSPVPTPQSPITKYSLESVSNWIEKWLSKKLKIDINKIDVGKSFADYGMDSVMAVELAQELEEWLERPLEATIIWNFPTIESLCKYLTNEIHDVSVEKPITSNQNQSTELDIEALINQEISELENLLEQGK